MRSSFSLRITSGNTRYLSSVRDWAEPRLPPVWLNSATTSRCSVFRIRHDVLIVLRPRGESTLPRTTPMTVTAFTGCSMIQSRAETTAPAKQMSIVWHRSPMRLLIRQLHREFRLHESIYDYSINDLLGVRRFHEPSMPGVRQGSSCFWAPIRR